MALVVLGIFGQAAFGAEAATEPEKTEPIRISADQLVADAKKQYAEFIGSVKAVQGDSEIKSDRLKIFYEGSPGAAGMPATGEKTNAGENPITKIEAEGNVFIHFQDKNGQTDKAVYDPKTKVLVLTGKNTRISSEGNHISGQTITFYRTEERITVERGETNRVEAEFYSKGAGIQ